MVTALLARGVPVDGVGHQMHDNFEFPSAQSMADTLDLFAGLGVTQHVTEMDVSVYSGSVPRPSPNYDEIPAERFLRQARHYRDFFRVFKAHKDQLTSVTVWGLADDNTWLTRPGRVDGPLLFDDQLQHKLAYTAIVSPQDLPRTPATVTLSNLVHTYDGAPHPASVTTSPAGLPVVVTYNGDTAAPVDAGSYAVVATIVSEDFAGPAAGTLTIAKATASIVLGGLLQVYDGRRTGDGGDRARRPGRRGDLRRSATPPTAPGSYAVQATIVDGNYEGFASATLVITTTALVRHAPTINGRLNGSIELLSAENTTLNGGAAVSGDLLVPGTPAIRRTASRPTAARSTAAGTRRPAGTRSR